jgi:hypothetical protein
MENTLASLIKDDANVNCDKDPWKCLQKQYLNNEFANFSIVTSLLKSCLDKKIQNPFEYLLFLRRFLSIIIAQNKNLSELPYVEDILKKIKKHKIYEDLANVKALTDLIFLLTKKSSKATLSYQEKSGKILQSYNVYWDFANISDIRLSSELSFLYIAIGQILNDFSFYEAAAKLASWHLNLFDNNQKIHLLWTQEKKYNKDTFLSSLQLMFYAAFLVTDDGRFKEKSDKILDQLKSFDKKVISPYFIFLTKYLKDHIKLKHFFENRVSKDESFFTHNNDHFSTAFTLSGYNSTIGSIFTKNDIKINAMGLQKYPLSDTSTFGIFQKDLKAEKNPSFSMTENSISGWIKSCCSFEEKDSEIGYDQNFNAWLEAKLQIKEKKSLDLNLTLKSIFDISSYNFVLYVNANSIDIDEFNKIEKNSLNKFSGNSKKITIKSKKDILTISPQNFSKMQIIPLAGSNCFWDSDFLIAFESKEIDNKQFKLEFECY